MCNKYDLILWDLDGTILDTKQSLMNAIEKTLKQNNYEYVTNEQLNTFIGPPFEEVMMELFSVTFEEANKLAVIFRDIYFKYEMFSAIEYDGIMTIIQDIKNRQIKQGLATYKSEKCVFPLMEYFKFESYFDTMHGSKIDRILTKAEIMELAMKDVGILNSEKILMVGDSIYDLEGAKEINCDFVFANYGFGHKEDIENAQYKGYLGYINKPTELINFI